MGANLVIVESPAKAKTINKFLGDDYTVKASFGHVRDLPADKLSIDVKGSFEPKYIVPADKEKVIKDLSAAAAKADTVWLASDEDREGEAIAWHLADTLKLDPASTRRIVFHEITKNAILNAVENPRDIDMNLVKAQQARRVLDRLVGYELSPVLWKKLKGGLSAGRVQSVAVRLIVDREREINAFTSQGFYRVEADFRTEEGATLKAILDHRFATEAEARAFLEKCAQADFSISGIDRKEMFRSPAAPFTTSLLQQEAGRKLGFSVSQTMSTAQRLYEAGLITYMRTDSTNLSSLALSVAKKVICDNFGDEYSRPRNYKTKSKGAQEAHEAIRPTYIDNPGINGTAAEKRLYDLIWKRTVASQMADARIERTTVTISGSNFAEKFTAQSDNILFDGFLKLYIEGTDDEETADQTTTVMPQLAKGAPLKAAEISATESFTQCPLRYSEPTLVKKLEELGIGRPSTYAPTIKTIIDRGYVFKGDKPATEREIRILKLRGGAITGSTKKEKMGGEKKKLFPENIGIAVTDYLTESFPDIVDYGFTARVEEDFDKIAGGRKVWNKVIADFYSSFHKSVEESLVEKARKTERVIGTDPATGKPVIARIARYGAIVQLGSNEDADKRFASLPEGMLIESVTLEEALRLLQLPRCPGQYLGNDMTVAIGKLGPYVKYIDPASGKAKYVSIPKNLSPYTITESEAISLIGAEAQKEASRGPIAEFKEQDIQILNGKYGPYIKHAGANYKIPRGTDPASIDLEKALEIIGKAGSKPSSGRGFRRRKA